MIFYCSRLNRRSSDEVCKEADHFVCRAGRLKFPEESDPGMVSGSCIIASRTSAGGGGVPLGSLRLVAKTLKHPMKGTGY